MQPWTRDHTKKWILNLENRIKDIDYFLKATINWCEDHYIYDDHIVFVLSFLTVLWVGHMRNETVTYNELLEILGLENLKVNQDYFYNLGNYFQNLEHNDLLRQAFNRLNDV